MRPPRLPTPFWLLGTLLAILATEPSRAVQAIDDGQLRMPAAGDYSVHVLAPTWIELTVITSPEAGARPVDLENNFRAEDFRVTCDGQPQPVASLGFKRRVLYAPLKIRDLRVATEIYLQLQQPLPTDAAHPVSIVNAQSKLWPGDRVFAGTTDPLRFNPAIHVNQEGYTPQYPKVAMVGYFLGTGGELAVPADGGFDVVDAHTGKSRFHGELRLRRDSGFTTSPLPYQSVYEADFTAFKDPGEYRLTVPKLGASLPFRIDDGEAMNFARAYALGLYHQRCGTAEELPFTRFTHAICHADPAEVPMPPSNFNKAWDIIAKLDEEGKPEQPEEQLKGPDDQLYPFVRVGKVDEQGGHHDAGDYSKYTINSANLIHVLMFAVDSLPGVAELDNLGLPQSGDGISDILQESKWESDFLAKMQDEDGGFYFLVYPRDRRYEGGTPDHGDPQIVWPKTTSVTAAAVAALAQCASSPEFKKHYPEDAKRYLSEAEHGWAFLMQALGRFGRQKAYQRLTHYGDQFADTDELAWAACELFVATGDPKYEKKLFDWFPNPSDPNTWQWNWRHAAFAYGNVLRSYAFAARSGRLQANQLNPGYLAKCESELRRAGDDAQRASNQSAYGVSFPDASKRIMAAGWFFPSDEAFDMTVAYQLQPKPQYVDAVMSDLNYEAGCNPVNRCFITGIGQQRQREIVHQYAQADGRVLPPTGIPLGSLQSRFDYIDKYKTELRDESWPKDDGAGRVYPLYDRWSDTYNLTTEFVIVNQGRSLASLSFWAAQTPLKTQRWKSAEARIDAPKMTVALNHPHVFKLEAPGLDLSGARIVWEGLDQEPAFGFTFSMVPRTPGPQWVEAEAAWPDGRRVFARATFRANAPVVIWVDGALPAGATSYAQGGDNWTWIKPASKPPELASHAHVLQHESALAEGIHEHGFGDAVATLAVDPGDVLFAYVFIDPAHPPKTLMLEFNDGSNEHRAFWGPNEIPYGKMNTESQRPMGPIPAAGRWVRLDVPAAAVGLEGHVLKGIVFRAKGGRVRWDAVGKMTRGAKELGIFHAPPPPQS